MTAIARDHRNLPLPPLSYAPVRMPVRAQLRCGPPNLPALSEHRPRACRFNSRTSTRMWARMSEAFSVPLGGAVLCPALCGRFTVPRRDRSELAVMLGVPESELGDYPPRFNIAPTQPYFVLKLGMRAVKRCWRPGASFREAFEKRRCVVPPDGILRMARSKGQARAVMDPFGERCPAPLRRPLRSMAASRPASAGRHSSLLRRPPIERSSRFTTACRLFSTRLALTTRSIRASPIPSPSSAFLRRRPTTF